MGENILLERVNMVTDEYYTRVQDVLFSKESSKFSYPIRIGEPRATFILQKEFSDLIKFFVYDFIVEIYQNFGHEITPKSLSSGCAKLTVAFNNTRDYRDLDFRFIILNDGVYHDIFKRFSVDRIFVYEFPPDPNNPSFSPHRFKTDIDGRPRPY